MNPPTAWQRLVAAARRAPDTRDTAAPFGFSARVAALAMTPKPRPVSLFDQFSLRVSLRVLGAASALAVAAAVVSYPAVVRLYSNNAVPAAPAHASRLSPAASGAPESSAAAETPSSDTPPVNPASGDDPVTELVDIVS